MRKIKLEFGGGLGDIFHQIYHGGAYLHLDRLAEGETAEVVLITHNPFARELFDHHPKRAQITVKDVGYWMSEQDAEMRRRLNIGKRGHLDVTNNQQLQQQEGKIPFYPAPSDEATLSRFRNKQYIVLAASAGLLDRTFPHSVMETVNQIAAELKNFALPIEVVAVGRNYPRHGRFEVTPPEHVTDVLDMLSVPGVAEMVRGSCGLITCHSALNILGWHEDKPQLLLYPKSVRDTHVAKRDQWVFGIDNPTTVHAEFSDYEKDPAKYMGAFIQHAKALAVRQNSLLQGGVK